MSRLGLALIGVIGMLSIAAIWRSVPVPAPGAATPVSSSSTGITSSITESAAARCEWDAPSAAELSEMISGAGSADEAFARGRCISHEAYDYELEIDSTITGATMLGKNNTVGRIPLRWVFGTRPNEGHWEGFGLLTSNTISLGVPTCPPGFATVEGLGVYDFQVMWVQISTDTSEIEVWVDSGPATEEFDRLRLPPCIGGGFSQTNFWGNQFTLSHFQDRGVHGLQIRGWTGSIGPGTAGLALAVTPETCRGMCTGTSTFTLHMTRRATP